MFELHCLLSRIKIEKEVKIFGVLYNGQKILSYAVKKRYRSTQEYGGLPTLQYLTSSDFKNLYTDVHLCGHFNGIYKKK
jgi:hypothetical protein